MHKYTDEQFIQAVKTSKCIHEALKKIGIVPAGGNYKCFHRAMQRLKLDTSHFTGQGWRKGERGKPVVPAKPLSEVLVQNSYYQTHKLRKRLLAEGVKKHICESCHLEKWQDKPIPLELHHGNGDSSDFRIENIFLYCPNCHALTPNYRGKNKKSKMVGEAEVESAS